MINLYLLYKGAVVLHRSNLFRLVVAHMQLELSRQFKWWPLFVLIPYLSFSTVVFIKGG